MFEFSFEFSQDYKELVVLISIIIWILCGVIFGISIIPDSPKPEEFVTSVSETNQPNCVVGAYVMFAKERLDEELRIGNLQKNYPQLKNPYVGIGALKTFWNDMHPTNKLICTFDYCNENTFTNKPVFGKPYIWVGKWDNSTNNSEYHACLMYFHPDSVTFKHFIYNPKTRYNYMVKTNYQFFFDRTMYLYQIK